MRRMKLSSPPAGWIRSGIALLAIASLWVSRADQTPSAYSHASLKGKSDEEIHAFMGGATRPSGLFGDDGKPTEFPPELWLDDPKEAALGFIIANRNAGNKKAGSITFRDKVHQPRNGWLVYNWVSSGCYSLSTSRTILRFGVDKPYLVEISSNSNGVVSRNSFADRTGRSLKIVPLSQKEATWIAQVVHWLSEVESNSEDDFAISGYWTSADGFGHLNFSGDREKELQDAVWAFPSVERQWRSGPYNDALAINLIHHLLIHVVAEKLGDRWPSGDPGRRSLMTPMEERLKPHESSDVLDGISSDVLTILGYHQKDPWPGNAFASIIECAGDLGLVKTRASIVALAEKLPQISKDEKRFRELEAAELRNFRNRNLDDLLKPQDVEKKKKAEELEELRERFKNDFSVIVREPLERARKQLESAGDPNALSSMAGGEGHDSVWALQQLQIRYPEVYANETIAKFRDLDITARRSLFESISAAYPDGARKLRSTLGEHEQLDLAVQLARFEQEKEPDLAKSRIPALIEVFEDKSGLRQWDERAEAVSLLSKADLSPAQLEQFRGLLVAEMKSPRKSNVGMSILSAVFEAVGRLPDASRHWDDLMACSVEADGFSERPAYLNTLGKIATAEPESRRAPYTAFFRDLMRHNRGLMNDLFTSALAMNLRELTPEIVGLATADANETDGAGATSHGGDFTGPASNRYHAARRVIALWSETDPETLASMWGSFAARNLHDFSKDSTEATLLRGHLSAALMNTSIERRKELVAMILRENPHHPASIPWLASLAGS